MLVTPLTNGLLSGKSLRCLALSDLAIRSCSSLKLVADLCDLPRVEPRQEYPHGLIAQSQAEPITQKPITNVITAGDSIYWRAGVASMT
jgi:hypothetical protein